MHLNELLSITIEEGASDLHISVDLPPIIRVDGKLLQTKYHRLTNGNAQRLIYGILSSNQIEDLERTHELDFCYAVPGIARFRCNVYIERGLIAAALRVIPDNIPSLEQLRMPVVLHELTRKNSGLILVTGPTGSGKSTTIASMIDFINNERNVHIMTIEDPIEYLHKHRKCMVHQRELKSDTYSFVSALRALLREDPDVLLIGEMRDLETISAAVTLAETGHLVFATLHTRNAPQTIDRIVDVFPPHQQEQIKVQLSNTLEAVIAQQLVPRIGGGRCAITEVMIATAGIRNLIRESKTFQIYSAMETGSQFGMCTMDKGLADAYRDGIITYKDAVSRAIDNENFLRLLRGY
ncbi:MAG: type IV pilus twitching motility protein PilT [Armatimonadota bacterium]